MTNGMFYLAMTGGLLVYAALALVCLVKAIIDYRKAKREYTEYMTTMDLD